MFLLPRDLHATARTQFGLVTVEQLNQAGVRGRRRMAAFNEGQLVPLFDGVYRLASHPDSFDQRCLAAILAAPGACLSGPTAGRLYGFRKVYTTDVHLLAWNTIELPGVAAHRSSFLRPADITTWGRLRILRPARLICDLARFLSHEDLESVIEQAIDRSLVDMALMRDIARLFARPGRDGSARLARVLDHRADWLRPADSHLEVALSRSLRSRGVQLVPQYSVQLDDGEVVRLDLAVPELRFGIEIDHVTWHGGRLDVQRDKRRDRRLMLVGWTVARVGDEDVTRRLATTTDELVRIIDDLRRRQHRAS
jgi:very-short-patch-repair endonuclease